MPAAGYPMSHNILIHLAGSQGFAPKSKHYRYPGAEPGFAEVDLESFDKIAYQLAWSRTLGVVRKGFEIEVDLEQIWDRHIDRKPQQPSIRNRHVHVADRCDTGSGIRDQGC